MAISNVNGLSAIQALIRIPQSQAPNPHSNLIKPRETDVVLSEARAQRFNEAISSRRGTFVPSFIPDDIAQSQRFSIDDVASQTRRS